ncbi:MAG: UPF0158 family protein [Chloroflexota bacterium]
MRNLKVNLEELVGAFDTDFAEMWHYLDLATGEIILVTDETRQQLEELLETCAEGDTIEVVQVAIQNTDLPDWEKETLYSAALVEFEYDTHVIEIPRADVHEGYKDMEVFIETIVSKHLQELLQVAIRGKGAFRRFKDVLDRYPQEREQWFQFRAARLKQRVLGWLKGEGITPLI